MLTYFDPQPDSRELPTSWVDPFAATPHPIARRAAEALQASLRTGEGLPPVDLGDLARPGRGKMFGVLVASDAQGRVGHLRAFSGMLDGRWVLPGFAPPIFDLAERDTYWPACEAEWRAFEVQVAAVTDGAEAKALRAELDAQHIRHAAEKDALRTRHEQSRAARHAERARLRSATLAEPDLARALHELGQQSRADEVEQRALFARHRAEREVLVERQRALDARRVALEEQRTARSREIWRRVTDGYRLPNARGELRTLTSLYEPKPVDGGAGDCAAPKLLAAAYRLRLKPLAVAEFWWGAPPATNDYAQGSYYPACARRCGVVLPWMLQGLREEAPSSRSD